MTRTSSPPARSFAQAVHTLLGVFFLQLVGAAVAAASDPSAPPNIVLIIADDLGWPYPGFTGNAVAQTPNIDALAAGGTVFRNGQTTASLCAPSHRTLLAGVYSVEWAAKEAALESVLGPIPDREVVVHFDTLPRRLAREGYLSWEGGRHWWGTYAQAGFTHGLATSIGGPFTNVGDQFGREGWEAGTALDPLRDFLDEAGESPFFVWFAPVLPHVPFNAPAVFRAPYEQMGLPWFEVDYYANLSWFDALVGELIAEIDARGLRDRTLFAMIADNGYEIGSLAGTGRGKGTIYELGYRTPLVFEWPGRLPAGVVRDDLVSALDLLPTLLDFAGAAPLRGIRGRSLARAIETGAPVGLESYVAFHLGTTPAVTGHFVRTPAWRYEVFADGREQLFDISTDPFEADDVATSHPSLLPAFRAEVAAWQADIEDGLPLLEASGRLVDALGAPVPGVELELSGRDQGGEPISLRVITGPDGGFRFDPLPRGIFVLERGRRVAELSSWPFEERIPITLPVGGLSSYSTVVAAISKPFIVAEPSSIVGSVVDGSGEPIAAAKINVSARAGITVRVVVRSDAEGRFRAENLPAGRYRIRCAAGSGLRPASTQIELPPGSDVPATLVLEPHQSP